MVNKKSNTVSMPVIRPNAAGIDIGADSIHVALPPDREEEVREFRTFTRDLNEMADWLLDNGITTVAMESTGVFWIPPFQILEARGIEVFLVNASHVKGVAGRKSDVKDSQWLQHLHSVGLLKASFRPAEEIAIIRSLTRHRSTLVRGAAQHIQRMQKSLTQMNIRLSRVISDISGLTGLAIIDGIIRGEHNPVELAKLKDRRIKATQEEIEKSLEGDYREEHIFTLHQSREAYRFAEDQLTECDQEIQRYVERYNVERDNQVSHELERRNKEKKLRLRGARDHIIHSEMHKAFGIDLFEIPGFATDTVLDVFTEVGTDFSKFPTEAAFTAWLSLCPNHEITGGKIIRRKTRPTKSRLNRALRQAAASLAGAKSYLGDLYRRLRGRLGAPKAVTAIAHRLARLLYHLVTTGQEYDESKYAVAEARQRDRQLKALTRKAKAFGFALVPSV